MDNLIDNSFMTGNQNDEATVSGSVKVDDVQADEVVNHVSSNSMSDDEIDRNEPILNPKNERFTIFPIQYHSVWNMYKVQMSAFWKAEEIDFTKDYDDFLNLSSDEQHFIKMILAFFAASDGIVNFNLRERFLKDVKIIEAQVAYGFQMMMESVHCVSANTKIMTENGYSRIIDLHDKNIKVWNGKQFAKTKVVYTGDSELHRIELSNGMYLDCTPEHKWFIRKGNKFHPEQCRMEKIFTKDLLIGDIISNYELPVVDTKDPNLFKNPYIHGFFCGDGTYVNKYPSIDLYGAKKDLLPYFGIDDDKVQQTDPRRLRFYITNKINKQKYDVPINYSTNTKLEWFEGYCDSDGCISNNAKKTATAIQITSINRDFLRDVQLMLTTLGINTNIKIGKKECEKLMPDGKEGQKLYTCKEIYVMYVTCSSVKKLMDLGFSPKRLQIKSDLNSFEQKKLLTVTSITKLDGIHKTYCFNEPLEHAGIFNGILTGQSEVYSLMLENIVKDTDEKVKLFNAIETVPSVKLMADFAFKWIESPKRFAYRAVAFAIIEGIFFSGAFAAIYWLKKYRSNGKHILNGLIKSNEFIARDEGMHVNFACLLYSLLEHKLNANDIYEMMDEAITISKSFTNDAIQCKLIGMNVELMNDYIEYIADRLIVILGYQKKYNKTNPFEFMETIGLLNKTNFFEHRPTAYSSAHTKDNVAKREVHFVNDF
jgi:ribonucleotide reductase beta subunit family protein with ferritin-like domain